MNQTTKLVTPRFSLKLLLSVPDAPRINKFLSGQVSELEAVEMTYALA